MSITVEAIYEDGVLKPVQPLPLQEHEAVRVTVEPAQQSLAEQIAARARALPQETLDRLPVDGAAQHDQQRSPLPIWERIAALTADAPADELEKPPTDGAAQHDHYLYGVAKGPE